MKINQKILGSIILTVFALSTVVFADPEWKGKLKFDAQTGVGEMEELSVKVLRFIMNSGWRKKKFGGEEAIAVEDFFVKENETNYNCTPEDYLTRPCQKRACVRVGSESELHWTTAKIGDPCLGGRGRCSGDLKAVCHVHQAIQVTGSLSVRCALFSNTTAMCWGPQYNSLTGTGTKSPDIATYPIQVVDEDSVDPLYSIMEIATSQDNTCFRLDDGSLRCAGQITDEFGVRSRTSTPLPLPLTGVVMVKADGRMTTVLLSDKTVRTWGNGHYSPVDVLLNDIKSIDSSIALSETGRVYVWDQYGTLVGSDVTNDLNLPVGVEVVSVHSYDRLYAVILNNGEVKMWGMGYVYTCNGVSDTQIRTIPLVNAVYIPNVNNTGRVNNAIQLSLGAEAHLILLDNGCVIGWGAYASYGFLGKKMNKGCPMPVVGTLNEGDMCGITSISTSGNMAIDELGQVLSWGRGKYGAIGDGKTRDRSVPVYVAHETYVD